MEEIQRELIKLIESGEHSVPVESVRAVLRLAPQQVLQDLVAALRRGERRIALGELLVLVTNHFLSELSWASKYRNRWSNAYVAQTKGMADVLRELTQALGCADEFGKRFALMEELCRPDYLERYEFVKKRMHTT